MYNVENRLEGAVFEQELTLVNKWLHKHFGEILCHYPEDMKWITANIFEWIWSCNFWKTCNNGTWFLPFSRKFYRVEYGLQKSQGFWCIPFMTSFSHLSSFINFMFNITIHTNSFLRRIPIILRIILVSMFVSNDVW